MRAFELTSFSGPDSLKLVDTAPPTMDATHVILEVRAIGVNFPDLLAVKGQYQHKPDLPFVPGCEVAGVIAEAPEGCNWKAGDRAAAFVWDGGYAERARVPVASLMPIPPSSDFTTAAAMVVNYHTAYFALRRRGAVVAGETVLVLGAAGGIGTAAVQVAKALGARVIAGVAAEEQRAVAISSGADGVLVLTPGFAEVVKEMNDGAGVDCVVDPLGDWLFTEATRALRPEGRLLVVGFAAGDIPTVRVNRLLLKNISVVGVAWGAFLDVDATIVATAASDLGAMYERGAAIPQIGAVYPFVALPDALRDLEAHSIAGKGVIVMDDAAGTGPSAERMP